MGRRRPQVNWMWLRPTSLVRSVIADLTSSSISVAVDMGWIGAEVTFTP